MSDKHSATDQLEACPSICPCLGGLKRILFNAIHFSFCFSLQRSLEFLYKLLKTEKDVWTQLDQQLATLSVDYNHLKAQLTELSTELPLLREEYNELEP